MDDAIPFAAIMAILAVFAYTTWPKQFLLAVVLGAASLIILAVRASELA